MDHDPRQDQSFVEEPTSSSSMQSQLRSVRQSQFFSAPPYQYEMPQPSASLKRDFGSSESSTESAFVSGAAPRPKTRSMSPEYPEIASSFEGESFGTPLRSSEAPPSLAKPLRVIHVGPCFMNGGVEKHTLSLAKFLDPRRIDLVKCLVMNPQHLSPRAVAAMPVPVEYCAPSELHHVAKECDVLLMWGDGFNGWLGPARPPLCVFVAHGESWWTAKTLQESSDVVDHAIAVSQRVRERVCGDVPSTAILNGVDASHLGQTCSREATRTRLGFSAQDFVLGCVGRFSEEKRMPLLIEAVSRLPREFKLLLVGHGARRNELLDLANERIPGRYAFASADCYLGDYYHAMDAFSLVSEHEGFGLVIAEAMLCERPVIVTDVGCVPEIIQDRVNGLVVDGTPDSIAAAVRLLQQNPRWARGLAAEGRAIADEKFHAAHMARQYEQLLWRLWNEKMGSSAGPAR